MPDAACRHYNCPLMPTRENLDEILRARSGDLQQTPYAILLLALALRERTAVLELRRTPLEKKIVFDAGSPVDCRSNIATETLGRFLVAQGRISEHDCHAALNQSTSRGVPLGEILIERKLLAPTELYRVLVAADVNKSLLPSGAWIENGGGEFEFNRLLSLRAGYIYDPRGTVKDLTYGLGLNYHGIRIDYASVPQSEFLSRVNRFSASYHF